MKPTHEFNSIVVLTGAGVSAESGLKTFRDNNGLWEDHQVEEVATPEAFAKNPSLVHRFYNQRRSQLLSSATPNLAHKALGKFESHYHGRFLLVTQNVDNLHEKGGSVNIRHMHGELLKVKCVESQIQFAWHADLTLDTQCPCCNKKSNLRPDIVWFGEIPMYMNEIEQALADCELFVSIGTSGNVYPAAGFVQLARASGAKTVELNLEPSAIQSYFDEQIYGYATETVSKFFDIPDST